jgi:ParB family chromosome partitioning protein
LSLPDEILKYIETSELSAGHARALLAIDDPEEQISIADRIIKNGLSVRDTEKIVKARKSGSLEEAVSSPQGDDKDLEIMYIKDLQTKASQALGKKIMISKANKPGAQNGRLEIEYKNNDELEGIIKILCGETIFD